MNRKTLASLAVLISLGTIGIAQAQTNWAWGGVDQDWANPSNWTAGVPGSNEQVRINDAANYPILSTVADRTASRDGRFIERVGARQEDGWGRGEGDLIVKDFDLDREARGRGVI